MQPLTDHQPSRHSPGGSESSFQPYIFIKEFFSASLTGGWGGSIPIGFYTIIPFSNLGFLMLLFCVLQTQVFMLYF